VRSTIYKATYEYIIIIIIIIICWLSSAHRDNSILLQYTSFTLCLTMHSYAVYSMVDVSSVLIAVHHIFLCLLWYFLRLFLTHYTLHKNLPRILSAVTLLQIISCTHSSHLYAVHVAISLTCRKLLPTFNIFCDTKVVNFIATTSCLSCLFYVYFFEVSSRLQMHQPLEEYQGRIFLQQQSFFIPHCEIRKA
jgi:hypothetical protein